MTGKNRSQLEVARGIASRREQDLAGEVGELQRMRFGARSTLERLRGYLDEYTQGSTACARPPMALANERHFVERLSRALEQQRAHTERLDERAGEKTAQWRRAQADVEALERAMARRQRAVVRASERREQRESDALGARRKAGQEDR